MAVTMSYKKILIWPHILDVDDTIVTICTNEIALIVCSDPCKECIIEAIYA